MTSKKLKLAKDKLNINTSQTAGKSKKCSTKCNCKLKANIITM